MTITGICSSTIVVIKFKNKQYSSRKIKDKNQFPLIKNKNHNNNNNNKKPDADSLFIFMSIYNK